MTRDQIQQRIVELDRLINQELGKTKLPSLNARHATFPAGSWGSAIVLAAIWAVGPNYSNVVRDFRFYILIVAIFVALYSLYATAMFLKGKFARKDAAYAQATGKVRDLQDERQELQRKLKELNS